MWSLPSRECGLKCSGKSFVDTAYIVTPFAGVWIEITLRQRMISVFHVTPFAGVWIEINMTDIQNAYQGVTPFAGVWIEIWL